MESENFEELTLLIEQGIEASLVEIESKFSDETFYAYALSTHGDVSSVSFHANSHENLQRVYQASEIEIDPERIEARFTELEKKLSKDSKRLIKLKNLKAAELAYYRWGWMEWLEYECIGDQEVMERTWQWLKDRSQNYLDEDGCLGEKWFDEVLEIVLNCMKLALKRCDERGLFGVGKAREDIVLYYGLYDGDTYGLFELNPKVTAEKYKAEFLD